MPKFMNMKYGMNLQLFAGEGAGDDPGDGGDQDDDSEDDSDDDADEGGDDEPKYTQADMDKALARTIAKERAKAERKAKKAAGKDDGKPSEEESEDSKARKEAEDRATKAEAKVACYDAGVAKDSVDDVVALARSYMAADEDLDLEDAIEKVVKKYPQFKKETADPYEEEDKKSWGQRQSGRGAKKMSGVERAFYDLNPDLKK